MERYKVTLYSVGHGTRTATAFVSLLCSFTIQHLADIRPYPGSKRNPQFCQESLRESVGRAGVSYTWLPHLGGLRRTGLDPQSPTKLSLAVPFATTPITWIPLSSSRQ